MREETEGEKSEGTFQETSHSKYRPRGARQRVVYPPLFSSLFYDRLYTRARVCRFQYNATEIIRPIVMKRK